MALLFWLIKKWGVIPALALHPSWEPPILRSYFSSHQAAGQASPPLERVRELTEVLLRWEANRFPWLQMRERGFGGPTRIRDLKICRWLIFMGEISMGSLFFCKVKEPEANPWKFSAICREPTQLGWGIACRRSVSRSVPSPLFLMCPGLFFFATLLNQQMVRKTVVSPNRESHAKCEFYTLKFLCGTWTHLAWYFLVFREGKPRTFGCWRNVQPLQPWRLTAGFQNSLQVSFRSFSFLSMGNGCRWSCHEHLPLGCMGFLENPLGDGRACDPMWSDEVSCKILDPVSPVILHFSLGCLRQNLSGMAGARGFFQCSDSGFLRG